MQREWQGTHLEAICVEESSSYRPCEVEQGDLNRADERDDGGRAVRQILELVERLEVPKAVGDAKRGEVDEKRPQDG